MIQELLGGRATGLVGGAGERKISINTDQGPAVILQTPFPPSSSSPSLPSSTNTNTTAATTTTTATTNISTTTTTSSAENQQNLRCPRCDSTNTKFCYYNNYNLTQPRHFCKTCRRYWTKGGALRNVPIGGGCRKNKGGNNSSCGVSSVTAGCAGKSIAAKARTVLSISDFDKRGSDLGNGFVQDHFHQQQHSNPFVWNSPSQSTSHILALLRAAQNPNPNPSPNPLSNAFGLMKSEGLMMNTAINGSNPGLDSYSRAPSPLGLCSSTGTNFWKNNDSQQQGHQQQSSNGLMMGEVVQNSGLQELFQKLKSSSPSRNYYGDHHPAAMFLSNNSSAVTCSSSPNSTMLESAVPAAANHDFGYFTSPSLLTSWSDLPTPNGAYP